MAGAANHFEEVGDQALLREGEALLSLNQERVMAAREIAIRSGQPASAAMICLCLAIEGRLDISALDKAMRQVVARHSALRTSIVANVSVSAVKREGALGDFTRLGIVPRGLYVQRLTDEVEIESHTHDLAGLASLERRDAIKRILALESATPFEEGKPLGLRTNLIRQNEADHVLIVTMDHRVSDGWSAGVLQSEIEQLYRHFAENAPAPPAPAVSYQEFTRRWNLDLDSPSGNSDLVYWEEQWRQFGGARIGIADLPLARVLRQKTIDGFQSERTHLAGKRLDRIRSAARKLRTTPYNLFLAGFLTVLRHYIGKTRLALWCHCNNRVSPESAGVIGFFVNTHLMGFDLSGDPTCRELLAQTASRRLETLTHQKMPLAHLWSSLQWAPLFNDSGITLDYMAERRPPPVPASSVTFRTEHAERTTAGRRASIGIYIVDRDAQLIIRSDYHPGLYQAEAVRNLLADLHCSVLLFARDPDRKISDFPHVSTRYADQSRVQRPEMNEFIVVGADRLPHSRARSY